MNPEITRIIEQYLSGELSQEDAAIFEDRLSKNEELRKELELHRSIHNAAKRAAVRSDVQQVAKQFHLNNNLKWGGLGFGILALIVTGSLLINAYLNHTRAFDLSEVKELTEELKSQGLIDNLKSEFFAWNANDTAFMSKEGVLVSVPNNAFLLNGKPYEDAAVIQWQEALDGVTIVKAGLSTVSNGKLLETQGMFSFSAKTPEGKQLTINPKVGVYIQVPVDEYKEGMKLFDGEKDKNGAINWGKPRELEKIPVPVPMNVLDFYPPEYETKLNTLKARKDKKYRDSLYLSFEEWDYGGQQNITNTPTTEKELLSGKYLFQSKCATCHQVDKNSTGPKLRNVRAKWANGGAKPGSIYTWVRDWQAACSSDSYAAEIAKWSPVASSDFPEMTNEQIDRILDFVDGIPYSNNEIAENQTYSYIPPSAVLAFWKPKFNNTLLATREFEARMMAIHKTCDKSVLDVYVRNLNKPMHELDEMVVKKGYSKFSEFAMQRVGALNPNNPHLKGLEAFYNRAVNELSQQARTLREQDIKRKDKWDQDVERERVKEGQRSSERDAQAFNEEYNLNHKNVRKQLGRVLGATIYGNNPISNIDRFVMETTLARKTNEYYDPVTGKTARIQYNEFSVEVADFSKYEKVFAYVFPDKLNSYHRIEGKDGKFSFPLNNEIMYDLAIVGLSVDGYSYAQRISLKGGDLGSMNLDRISEAKLDASIRSLNAKRGIQAFDVKEEIRYLIKEKQNYTEQKRRSDDHRFRNELRPKVFPCGCHGAVADTIELSK